MLQKNITMFTEFSDKQFEHEDDELKKVERTETVVWYD